MKKRTISLLLALIMLFSLVPTAFAASDEATSAANALYELGLFQGTGTEADGKPIFDLDRTPTRHEAVTMLVRLLGKDAEAKAGSWTTPFTDVDEWAKPYVGYAYANGLTSGTGATTFGGTAVISASQYLTFVLRALGYTSGTDFQWDKAWELSDQIGLTDKRYHAGNTQFTRGDIAIISDSALNSKEKGTNNTLLDLLMASSAVDLAAAKAYQSTPVRVKSITLNQIDLSMNKGDSAQLTATVLPDNATDKSVTWVSSNPEIVNVSSSGLIKAKQFGTVKITATASNGLFAVCDVTVKPVEVASITLSKATLVLTEGKTEKINATVSPSNAEDKSITWSSSNPSVATVSNGTITAVKQGSAVITATASSGVSASCSVNVQPIKWYSPDTYRVGTDIPAGDYYAVATDSRFSGYYCKYTDSSKKDIEDNDNFDTFTYFRAYNGQYLVLNRCKVTAIKNAPVVSPNADGSYGEGTYRVGIDIPEGEYKFSATDSKFRGYYCAYTDITYEDIEDNENFDNSSYYTVRNGQYLVINRAKATHLGGGTLTNQGSGTSTGSSTGSVSSGEIVYYNGYYGVPDLGAMLGVNTASNMTSGNGTYIYKSSDVYAAAGRNALSQYVSILKDCGFTGNLTIDGDNADMAYYKNKGLGLEVTLSVTRISSGEYVGVTIFETD